MNCWWRVHHSDRCRGDKPFGADLVALNAQRGREHGIADYNTYRQHCNLPRAATFDDLAGQMDAEVIRLLSSVCCVRHGAEMNGTCRISTPCGAFTRLLMTSIYTSPASRNDRQAILRSDRPFCACWPINSRDSRRATASSTRTAVRVPASLWVSSALICSMGKRSSLDLVQNK